MPKENKMPDEATIDEPKVEEDGFIAMPETPPEPPDEEPPAEPVEEPPAEEPPAEEPPAEPAEEPPAEEPPAFEFAEEEPTKPFMVVKHLGKEIPIATEEDAKNYIQKGVNYDHKVGPHGKLAKIMDEYPDFANKVAADWEAFVAGRQSTETPEPTKPELKSLDDYKDPNDWLMDNVGKLLERVPKAEPTPSVAETPPWVSAVVARDPDNFNKVAPLLPEYAEKYLTKAQYDKVNNDLPSLVRFYDKVKEHVIGKPKETPPAKPNEPAFRVKSGGGEAPSDTAKPPWEDKNNEEFEEYMAGIKGEGYYQ